jgi:hypothetical protein
VAGTGGSRSAKSTSTNLSRNSCSACQTRAWSRRTPRGSSRLNSSGIVEVLPEEVKVSKGCRPRRASSRPAIRKTCPAQSSLSLTREWCTLQIWRVGGETILPTSICRPWHHCTRIPR